MTKARQLADLTWEKGKAERRDWNPAADSAHFRVYRWWLSRTNNPPIRENFCHYWRVVLIWAPLRWLLPRVLIALGVAALAGIVWLIVLFPTVTPLVLLSIFGFVYLVYSMLVISDVLNDLRLLRNSDPVGWFGVKSNTGKMLLVLSVVPPLAIVAPIGVVFAPIVMLFGYLEVEYEVFSRTADWFVYAHPASPRFAWLRPWEIFPLALVVWACVPSPSQIGGLIVLAIVAGFCLIVGLIALLAFIADKATQRKQRKRYQQRKAEIDELLEAMFKVLHPEKAGDRAQYLAWREKYDRRIRLKYGYRDVYEVPYGYQIHDLSPKKRRAVAEILGKYRGVSEYRKPSKFVLALKRGAANVGDYLSLIWSVVLTNKWKICPWVELPD